jgi:hypothetical protein
VCSFGIIEQKNAIKQWIIFYSKKIWALRLRRAMRSSLLDFDIFVNLAHEIIRNIDFMLKNVNYIFYFCRKSKIIATFLLYI